MTPKWQLRLQVAAAALLVLVLVALVLMPVGCTTIDKAKERVEQVIAPEPTPMALARIETAALLDMYRTVIQDATALRAAEQVTDDEWIQFVRTANAARSAGQQLSEQLYEWRVRYSESVVTDDGDKPVAVPHPTGFYDTLETFRTEVYGMNALATMYAMKGADYGDGEASDGQQ